MIIKTIIYIRFITGCIASSFKHLTTHVIKGCQHQHFKRAGSIVSLPVPMAVNLINSFLPILGTYTKNKILLTFMREHSVSIIYSRILCEKEIWSILMIENSAQIRTSYNTEIGGLNMIAKQVLKSIYHHR